MHIIIEGTDEEIGYDLACLGKKDYGAKLNKYVDPVYGRARRTYMERNWPQMAERAKGVRRAFGLPEDDLEYDALSLPYDI